MRIYLSELGTINQSILMENLPCQRFVNMRSREARAPAAKACD
jgi:hypothetical protein